MNNPEQAFGLRGRRNPVLQATLFLLLLLSPLAGLAQQGTSMQDAIPMDISEFGFYWDDRNNGYYNGISYYDYYHDAISPNAQPSSDVWYSFTTSSYIHLDVSATGSNGFDTYVHLLDRYSNDITYVDGSLGYSLTYSYLPPGTYYIVVEGDVYTTGDYSLAMDAYAIPPPFILRGLDMSSAVDVGTLVQNVSYSGVATFDWRQI